MSRAIAVGEESSAVSFSEQEILFLVWPQSWSCLLCHFIGFENMFKFWRVSELCSFFKFTLCILFQWQLHAIWRETAHTDVGKGNLFSHVHILLTGFIKYIIICNYLLLFQTLHMKEEENKRLSQRLVNIYFFICVCVHIFVLALALIFHLNVLIVWEYHLTSFKLIIWFGSFVLDLSL